MTDATNPEVIDVPSFIEARDDRVTQPPAEPESATETAVRPEPEPQTEGTVGALLATVDDAPPADLSPMPDSEEFRSILTMARVLADSSLVPSDLRGKPHDVALILLTGRELGIAPTAALRSCYVVDHRVTLAPALKQAIVTDRGLGKVRPAPGNNAEQATWIAFEPDGNDGWQEAGRLTLTMDEMAAAQNGTRGRLIDKDNWQSYPARMLSARCRGWLIDDIWPEAALGLYSPDEVGAFTNEDGEPIDVASYENVPDGYRKTAPAPPTLIPEEVAEALRLRLVALPQDAQVLARGMLRDRDVPLPLNTAPEPKAKIVEPIIGGLEKRAANGEWGDWPPDAGYDEAPPSAEPPTEAPADA